MHCTCWQVACAFRCDKYWPGLDTGRCFNGDTCPDPMDKVVTDDICWGLPVQPVPGDILLHDTVLFDNAPDCGAYINAWENKAALAARQEMYSRLAVRNVTGTAAYVASAELGTALNATADKKDKISFSDRGSTWDSVMQGALSKCVGIGGKAAYACKSWVDILKDGMNGQQVRECIQDCAAMLGIEALEQYVCHWAAASTGPFVDTICGAVGSIIGPVNAVADKYLVTPIVKVATKVEDALYSAGKFIGHVFHFW